MKFFSNRGILLAPAFAMTGMMWTGTAAAQGFAAGDLVISTVSIVTMAAVLDTAAPIVLDGFQLGANATSATMNGSLTLPQTASGANAAISGEYGSASEGLLQQSANGNYLTIMGYGVNATAFNTGTTYGTAALGQTTSLLGGANTTVRVWSR